MSDEIDKRCPWCLSDPAYIAYHDQEWGRPIFDSKKLWECLLLESFQAGLSWITILRKREGFRAAFAGFDPNKVAEFTAEEVSRLVQDASIIRHRGKIEAAIKGAQAWQEIEARDGFSNFIWGFVDGAPIDNQRRAIGDVPAQTERSQALSKALKAEGFKFCGPTISYAFMQAAGLVNDHLIACPAHSRT